ncbi:hypothetical protein [Chryseosolibacter indicus]|uniref:Outer membrane protein beta-barrel domain-containing protein n=1 Tax=Chryseosolibacter indicus TaxID=2782351 RepID=A0ABS5VRX7_9BACT|nr:hypothetical protein [Chryseosolibacter indicus]MBT1703604.1 hypothetical protein [Chryseosolibacter indicus]
MKKVLTLFLFFSTVIIGVAQDQGIGLRLGDPLGVTYKKYFGDTRAIEFGLGSTGFGSHRSYYRNSFDSRSKYDDYRYRSHRVESTVYLQARYLLHYGIDVQGLEGKWDWYWGVGGMLKVAKVRYRFFDDVPPFEDTDTRTDIDFGPEGIIGMEYTFQDVPISVFGEISLLLEIVDRVTLRPFGGVGVRYNF